MVNNKKIATQHNKMHVETGCVNAPLHRIAGINVDTNLQYHLDSEDSSRLRISGRTCIRETGVDSDHPSGSDHRFL
jgi:hypothetical protein